MRSQRKHTIIAIVGIFGLVLLSSCTEGLGGILIGNQQEVELGIGVDQQLKGQYAVATPDDPAAIWARELVATLTQGSLAFRDPNEIGGYKVEIIADDALVNAFAAPGGFTYISTGLILQAETCAEIAGVMGHELAHVTERHSVKAIEGAYAAEIASTWFLGEGLAGGVASTVYGFLQQTQFSQSNETESDEVGLQIAYDAGYNPHGLADFFAKLLELEQMAGVSVPEFLSSHPATADRVAAVTASIEQRYGAEAANRTKDCIGTTLQLADLKAHVQSGMMTTVGPTAAPTGE